MMQILPADYETNPIPEIDCGVSRIWSSLSLWRARSSACSRARAPTSRLGPRTGCTDTNASSGIVSEPSRASPCRTCSIARPRLPQYAPSARGRRNPSPLRPPSPRCRRRPAPGPPAPRLTLFVGLWHVELDTLPFQEGWRSTSEVKPGTERTEFQVLYDDKALYVAGMCYDSRPDPSRRQARIRLLPGQSGPPPRPPDGRALHGQPIGLGGRRDLL